MHLSVHGSRFTDYTLQKFRSTGVVRRVLCVAVFILMMQGAGCQTIDTTGCYLRDPYPTSPCDPIVATVDSLSQLVLLTWHPSSDSDILGYRLCVENHSLWFDYDTVWGATDTQYVCADLASTEAHRFRIMAFDSCLKGSPLSDPLGNMVLRIDWDSCRRICSVEWNAYENENLQCYEVEMFMQNMRGGVDTVRSVVNRGEAPTRFYAIDTGVVNLRCRIAALLPASLRSYSNICTRIIHADDPCHRSDTTHRDTIVTFDDVKVWLPTVFVPSQSSNSIFAPIFDHPERLSYYRLVLFNRQGLQVFATEQLTLGWDGTRNSVAMPQGVYVYHLRFQQQQKGVRYLTGTVLLCR